MNYQISIYDLYIQDLLLRYSATTCLLLEWVSEWVLVSGSVSGSD
jgi:hypothetical protein